MACEKHAEKGRYVYMTAPVDSIRVTAAESNALSLICYVTVPDPCWELTGADVKQASRDFSVKVRARREKSKICIAIPARLEIPVRLRVQQAGDYELRFWRSDTSRLDTTLMIQ